MITNIVNITQQLLTSGQGGRPGKPITPKGVVIHWTANKSKGADAQANRNYFENHPANKVAAHYIVDDTQIIQCVPENEMAYHVGANSYTTEALEKLSVYPNDCTIGIEMCVNEGIDFTAMYCNAVRLATDILWRWGWTVEDLWRHYDITGKDCPQYFVSDDATAEYNLGDKAKQAWLDFKILVEGELDSRGGVKAMGHWADGYMTKVVEAGIMNNERPDDLVTRAELAVVICRLLGLEGTQNGPVAK
jgi:N-acetylmuramoyl-L-alanine amidase CwlA